MPNHSFKHIKIAVIITCGGTGARFAKSSADSNEKPIPKQFLTVEGLSILEHSLNQFKGFEKLISTFVVTAPKNYKDEIKRIADACALTRPVDVVEGGSTRAASVRLGVEKTVQDKAVTHILVHDGVRPNVSNTVIQAVLDALQTHPAVIPGVPISDTLKQITQTNLVEKTINRDTIVGVQTPQGFRVDALLAAYESNKVDWDTVTDEASLMEATGYDVCVVPGDKKNIKITTIDDLNLYKWLRSRAAVAGV